MKENILTDFKASCQEYLSSLSIGSLRAYGRHVGVSCSTEKKKAELIDAIVAVLVGEVAPAEKKNLGAPVKDHYIDPNIAIEIEKRYNLIKKRYDESKKKEEDKTSENLAIPYTDVVAEMREFRKNNQYKLRVEDPQAAEQNIHNKYTRPVYRGQLELQNGVAMLLDLRCVEREDKIVVPVELIRKYDLREGDFVACYVEMSHTALVATEILAINNIVAETLLRQRFEEAFACYPSKRILTYKESAEGSAVTKYMQWLLPLGRGQRGLVLSSPKAGKTGMLLHIAKSVLEIEQNLTVLVLLIDQSPETVGQFRKIVPEENLLYTTYDDSPQRQVFVAEFLLKRAKRLAECGQDVLILVDSFNALARAFNDTDASMGGRVLVGGLESKTLQYIKKYFGAARCFEKGGSLTVLGAVSVATGNPVDDLIGAEISTISNLEVRLSDTLALKRIYPAIDLAISHVKQEELLFSADELAFNGYVRSIYAALGGENLQKILEKATSYNEFVELIEKTQKA